MSELDDRTERHLADIVGFSRELQEYVTALGERNFHDDRPTQLVAEALLHRIGEAVARLDDDFVSAHPEIEWQKIKGMRNVVAQEHGFIDHRIVWRALTDALPRDIALIERILAGS